MYMYILMTKKSIQHIIAWKHIVLHMLIGACVSTLHVSRWVGLHLVQLITQERFALEA